MWAIFIVDYLREYELILKAHESGYPGCCLTKETKGRKSHAAVPLNHQLLEPTSKNNYGNRDY
jgi:hypothetical protein